MSKKTLVSAITAALVVGAASTTFAAANPFSDVPADSWAYDAVSTLAADGVIDGYPDGTYQGQNTMTRYEMAQIVARAMAKTDLEKADKALVDKLAAEFAEELDNLGVRVADLEKKSDNVKWGGELRYRYYDANHDAGEDTTYNRVMFRLAPKAYIGNSGWTANARINYSLDMGSDSNAIIDPSDNDASVDLAYVEGPLFGATVQAGKLPVFTATGLVFDDKIAGVQATFGSDVFKTTLAGGRFTNNPEDAYAVDAKYHISNNDVTTDFYGIQFDYTPNEKLALNAGYNALTGLDEARKYFVDGDWDKTHQSAGYDYATYGDDNDAQIWYVGGKYAFNNSIALNAEYAQNTSAEKDDDAWIATLNYKGADVADAGSWGMYAGYADLGKNSVPAPTYDEIAGGQKGFIAGVSYVPAENILATVKYFTGEDSWIDGNKSNDADKFFANVDFFF
ncbi:S-layer homology domain-containing protein [uncultured Megamonas sp.]|uniref:S-layer homology domain-containing protein n=1 Tax=uncultured Megamonas sp. TaxID=286140 RepID=UPI00259804BC|nr:S-layer homology domain-containing protein [uncultured Megamonas sp.]